MARSHGFVVFCKCLTAFFTHTCLGSEQMDLPRRVTSLHRGRKLRGCSGQEGLPEPRDQPRPALMRTLNPQEGQELV